MASQSDERLPEFGSGLRAYLRRMDAEPALDVVEPGPAGARPRPDELDGLQLDRESRLFLAHRVEEHAESLWAVFADALAATTTDGRPDHRTRMLAAKTLLAEAVGPAAKRPGKRPRVKDELAELRRRRAAR